MYDNIGGKIKSLAKWIFFVDALSAIIAGIVFIVGEAVGYGLLVIGCGVLIAWVSTWTLYGFGQLVENSDIIAEQYERKNEKHRKKVSESNERKQNQRYKEVKTIISDDSVDDGEFIDFICPNCKEQLSYTKAQLQSKEELTCPLCDAPISFE